MAVSGWEIEPLTHKHGDLDFIYYVWQVAGKETWVSIFDVGQPSSCDNCYQHINSKKDRCIVVGLPTDLINKYNQNTYDDG